MLATKPVEATAKKSYWVRFLLFLPALFLYLLLLTVGFKLTFLTVNFSLLHPAEMGPILKALWNGLRFDAAILSYFLIPALLLYFAASFTRWRPLRWILSGYLVAIVLLNSVLWLADLQYFEEAGKHFTYEAFSYLGISLWPDISGAFRLHPWLSSLSLIASVGLVILTGFLVRGLLSFCLPRGGKQEFRLLLSFPFFILLLVVGARGGLQDHPLNIGDSLISPSPYLNALCLNPVYSAFITMVSYSPQRFQFFNEEFNIRKVRDLLGCNGLPASSARYPLLRLSPGREQGNGKNVVIFLLESWSAKDVGCLGGRGGATPFFDGLAREGLLFRNFYATGLRTPEALISILCSFPNQPVRPVMGISSIYQIHWRSLSQILSEAGYRTLFLYGRDLEFAHAREFLEFIRFDQVIDKRNFPSSVSPSKDSWAGYDDEEIMRRADQEFTRQGRRPFFAVISTMNTHPPFTIPKGFPRALPPTSVSNKFLNSLHYSDYALRLFFRLAKSRPYFENTIFLFVADHARTREELNLSEQHHIPLLIYAPGHVQPGFKEVVGSQVDLLPTILALLEFKASHASWGRNLLQVGEDDGFAVCVSGSEVRWRNSKYLLNDSLTDQSPFLFDITKDPDCTTDLWKKKEKLAKGLKTQLRAYISLSQALLYQNRIYP